MAISLLPHVATYAFQGPGGADAGSERVQVERVDGGWRITSRLELRLPFPQTTEVDWRLEPDLATRILWLSARNAWGEEHDLELAITGNGVLASRGAPDGPSQVEMGFGPRVELDHLSAAFTSVLLARWDLAAEPVRRIRAVYIRDEDLMPEPMEQDWRVLDAGVESTTVERTVPASGSRARVTAHRCGVVLGYEGLFAVGDWRLTA